jgi:hypothetical protein
VVGNKGEKGILKYPTKKGYLDDKFGLPGNLWAVRIKDRQSKDFAFGKFLFLNDLVFRQTSICYVSAIL